MDDADEISSSSLFAAATLNDDQTCAAALAARFSILICVVASLYVFAWQWWLRPRLESKKPFESLPMPQPNHWFLGHITSIISGGKDQLFPLATSKEQQEESPFWKSMLGNGGDESSSSCFGGRFGIWVGPERGFCPLHWEDARALLLAEYYKKRFPLIDKHMNRVAGENTLLILTGRLWKIHRAAVLKSFKTPSSLSASTKAILKVTRTVVGSLKERMQKMGTSSIEFDLEPLTKMITVDVIGLAAFSHDFGCCQELRPQAFARAFDFLGGDLNRRLDNNPLALTNYFYCIPTKENVQNNKFHRFTTNFIRNIIEQHIQQQEQEKQSQVGSKGCDILSNLLRAHKDLKNADTSSASTDTNATTEDNDAILLDVMKTLLFAGYDTTSVTLAYALYLISQDSEIEANCLEEINALADNEDTMGKAEAFVYCGAVVRETLRLYPPAFVTTRNLLKPVELPRDGFTVPAGTYIFLPIWHIHRDEHNFAQPHEFRPDRWVKRQRNEQPPGNSRGGKCWVQREYGNEAKEEEEEEEEEEVSIPAANPNALFSFSAGARSCPGQQFAMQEAVLVIVGLLKELKFRAARPDYVLTPTRNGVIQHPGGGMPMNISIREAHQD